jgi:hypothetical protein
MTPAALRPVVSGHICPLRPKACPKPLRTSPMPIATRAFAATGPDQINEAYERMLKSDVRYRFVIDMEKLAA